MRAFGGMVIAALTLASGVAAAGRAPTPALPPLARRLHEDSLRFVSGITAQKFDSLNTSFIRDIADARRMRNEFALGRLLVFQGAGYAMTGAPLQAAPALDEAIPLAEAQHDTTWLLIALRWRTYAAGMLGRLDEQQRFAQRLVAVAEVDSNLKFLAIGNNFMGWIARQRGELKQARKYLERAVEGHRALHADGDEAFARSAYGATLMDLGEFAAARRSYARQIELAQRLHLDFTVAQAYNDLGVLEAQVGDPGKAVEYVRRAYLVLKARGETPDAVGTLVNLAGAEMALGRAENAAELSRQGLEVCERRGFGGLRGSLLNVLASAEDALGHSEAAQRAWQRVIALGDSTTAESRSMAIMGESRVFEKAGRYDESLALVESEGGALLPRLGREQALRFQNGWASRLCRVGRYNDAMALAQHVLEGSGGIPSQSTQAAWELLAAGNRGLGRLELTKADFDSACAVWEHLRGRPSDPEWRTSFWTSPGRLRLACVQFQLAWPAAAPESTRIAAAYDRLQRFRTRTLLEQASSHGGSSLLAALPVLPPLREVQARLLSEGELLLEWAIGDEKSYLFACTRTERRCFDLGDPAALAAKIRTARALLASAPRTSTDPSTTAAVALELSRVVFGPALPMVERAKALVLVPDGPVHLVPFAALVLHSGPLVATRTLAIAPSVAVLAQARGRGTGPGRGMLVVSAVGGASPLVGARREAEWLTSAFEGVQRAEGAPQGSEQFATTLRDFGALHFAGHTSLDDRFPWRSGIDVGAPALVDPVPNAESATTRETTAPRDLLRAETIAATQLAARLVVLSSCETAGGQSIEGEGVSGLSTAFIAAGARTVIASLWPVDDRATETLMREFYRVLASGKTSAVALRDAQERVRRTRATSHPYYWAGFELIGDGRTTLPLTPTPLWKRAMQGKSLGARAPSPTRPGPAHSPAGL